MTKAFAYRLFLVPVIFLFFYGHVFGQRDTARRMIPQDSLNRVASPVRNKARVDSVLNVHSPRKATIRSAIIPGWGQAYNKKYWKIPIIYGALGTTAAIFIYNLNNYKTFKTAFAVTYAMEQGKATHADSAVFTGLPSQIQLLAKSSGSASLKYYRDDFRRNIDYSVLVFIVFWGLNIADAAVDAHLKSFDVSPDLSLRFHLGHSQMANTNGLSLILAFK